MVPLRPPVAPPGGVQWVQVPPRYLPASKTHQTPKLSKLLCQMTSKKTYEKQRIQQKHANTIKFKKKNNYNIYIYIIWIYIYMIFFVQDMFFLSDSLSNGAKFWEPTSLLVPEMVKHLKRAAVSLGSKSCSKMGPKSCGFASSQPCGCWNKPFRTGISLGDVWCIVARCSMMLCVSISRHSPSSLLDIIRTITTVTNWEKHNLYIHILSYIIDNAMKHMIKTTIRLVLHIVFLIEYM